jgi:hypothetical protein
MGQHRGGSGPCGGLGRLFGRDQRADAIHGARLQPPLNYGFAVTDPTLAKLDEWRPGAIGALALRERSRNTNPSPVFLFAQNWIKCIADHGALLRMIEDPTYVRNYALPRGNLFDIRRKLYEMVADYTKVSNFS